MTQRGAPSDQAAQRRIDAHHHLWDLAVRDQDWTAQLPVLHRTFDMDELRPSLLRHRIDATVLVQTVSVPDETPQFLQIAAADPHVAGVVGWVELTDPAVADRLAALAELPGRLVGIRHGVQSEPDPDFLRRADVQRGVAAVGAAGLAYDLLVTAAQLPAAIAIVQRLPEVRFVLDHGAKPPIAGGALEPWRGHIRELARCANVTVKLSGLVTEAGPSWTTAALQPYGRELLDAFGADRVMYGSDWPVCLLAADYDAVVGLAELLTADLSADEQAAVFGGTAASWYRLP